MVQYVQSQRCKVTKTWHLTAIILTKSVMLWTWPVCMAEVYIPPWVNFFYSSSKKSKPAWLIPKESRSKAKEKYFCCISTDGSTHFHIQLPYEASISNRNICTFTTFYGQLGSSTRGPFNLKTTAKVKSETSWCHSHIPLQVSLEILR